MAHDEKGREIPDPRPVEWPLQLRRPETLAETIQRHIRGHISNLAEAEGFETEAEANDFDVGEDADYVTGYEIMGDESFMPTPPIEAPPSPPPAEPIQARAAPGKEENAAGAGSPGEPPPNPAPKS